MKGEHLALLGVRKAKNLCGYVDIAKGVTLDSCVRNLTRAGVTLDHLSVEELKTICKKKGELVNGRKAQLAQRLGYVVLDAKRKVSTPSVAKPKKPAALPTPAS